MGLRGLTSCMGCVALCACADGMGSLVGAERGHCGVVPGAGRGRNVRDGLGARRVGDRGDVWRVYARAGTRRADVSVAVARTRLTVRLGWAGRVLDGPTHRAVSLRPPALHLSPSALEHHSPRWPGSVTDGRLRCGCLCRVAHGALTQELHIPHHCHSMASLSCGAWWRAPRLRCRDHDGLCSQVVPSDSVWTLEGCELQARVARRDAPRTSGCVAAVQLPAPHVLMWTFHVGHC
jgi:hypothetical protein